MDAIAAFLQMGGYGAYVWPAFGVTVLVLVWMGLSTARRLRENERMLARLEAIRREIAARESGNGDGTGEPGRDGTAP